MGANAAELVQKILLYWPPLDISMVPTKMHPQSPGNQSQHNSAPSGVVCIWSRPPLSGSRFIKVLCQDSKQRAKVKRLRKRDLTFQTPPKIKLENPSISGLSKALNMTTAM